MPEKKEEQRYRVSGFVREEIYERLLAIQMEERKKKGRKPTMGEVIEMVVEERG